MFGNFAFAVFEKNGVNMLWHMGLGNVPSDRDASRQNKTLGFCTLPIVEGTPRIALIDYAGVQNGTGFGEFLRASAGFASSGRLAAGVVVELSKTNCRAIWLARKMIHDICTFAHTQKWPVTSFS